MSDSFSDRGKNDANRAPSEHAKPTPQDIPGVGKKGGAARASGKAAVERTKKQKSRLDEIMGKIKN